MFGKKNKFLTAKDLDKKINWQLNKNFFSLAEAKNFSVRKLRKILKYISKIEEVSLTRKEIKEIALFIKSDYQEHKDTAQKLWTFLTNFEIKTKICQKIKQFSFFLTAIKCYLYKKFIIMRN